MTSLKKKIELAFSPPKNDHAHFYRKKTSYQKLKLTTENKTKVESESPSNPLCRNLQD